MFGAINYYLAGGGAAAPVPFGCATYSTAGTFTFVVPSGVSKISVVCIGAGGTGGGSQANYSVPGFTDAGWGNGGALSYTNCICVTPGESLTVKAGNFGPLYSISTLACNRSESSSVSRGATILISAQGGGGNFGVSQGLAACGVGAVKYSAGSSAPANYVGNGANAGALAAACSGGASGGAFLTAVGYNASGGVGLYGKGATATAYSQGGSGGTNGGSSATAAPWACANTKGGNFGGGGSGSDDCDDAVDINGGYGGIGGVRIIYGGVGKSYPNNAT
jgi:hypothetical protein